MVTHRVLQEKTFLTVALVLFGLAGLAWHARSWDPDAGLNIFRGVTALADVDGDGDLDVIVGRTRWEDWGTSFAGIKLWLNQGGGQFTPADQTLPAGFAAAAGDVDGDGDADLVVLDGYELTVTLNQGGAPAGRPGLFAAYYYVIRPPDVWRGHADMGGSLVLADLNDDGKLDGLVAGCCFGSSDKPAYDTSNIPSNTWVWINEWDADNRLVRRTQRLGELDGLPVRAAAPGDLDGDGDLDVWAALGKPTLGGGSSQAGRILLNDGAGDLADSGQRLGQADSTSVALGDVDGDGDLDALLGTRTGALVWINQRDAQGRPGVFVSGQTLAVGPVTAVFFRDLNGDGRPDALLAGGEQAAIWWNDGRGLFQRSDQRLRYSNRHVLAVGDFNGDSSPDIFAGTLEADYSFWLNLGQGAFQLQPRP